MMGGLLTHGPPPRPPAGETGHPSGCQQCRPRRHQSLSPPTRLVGGSVIGGSSPPAAPRGLLVTLRRLQLASLPMLDPTDGDRACVSGMKFPIISLEGPPTGDHHGAMHRQPHGKWPAVA